MIRLCVTAVVAATLAMPAFAQATNPVVPDVASDDDAVIWAWTGQENLCPFGAQPVTVDGTISCGVPNQELSYQQMLKNPQGN